MANHKWLDIHPIADAAHEHDLEKDAALGEFHQGLPRAQAEHAAYSKYREQMALEGAKHHYKGAKAALAVGDKDRAEHHHTTLYGHLMALGNDPKHLEAIKAHAAEGGEYKHAPDHPADALLEDALMSKSEAVQYIRAELLASLEKAWPKKDPNAKAHNCGGPKFGKLKAGCPRCDELSAGAAPRAGWNDAKKKREAQFREELRRHDCKARGCGSICTFGDW